MLAVLFAFRSMSCSIDASRLLSPVSGSCLGTTVAEESCDAAGAGAGAEAEVGAAAAAAGGGGCEADESAMVVVLIVNEGEWW